MDKQKRISLLIAFMATIVRFYDYAIFGLSASLLSRNFLPGDNGQKMLGFFAVFSLATMARPVGAIIFGSIGDRLGRVYSIKIATILASISTMSIAFIPTFEVFGNGSIILLTISRMMFLISLSGEVDAIKIFVTEMTGTKSKHIAMSLVTFSSQIGVLIASILYHFAINFENIEWLWRANFLFGGCLGIIIILLRNNLHESAEFLNIKNDKENEYQSTISILKNNKLKFTIATILNGIIGSGYQFLIIFLGTFMSHTANLISNQQASINNIFFIISYALSSIVAGYISEKTHSIWQPIIALICSIILLLYMINNSYQEVVWVHNALIIIIPFYTIPTIIYIQYMFSIRNRMRMCGISHSVGSLLISSTTPLICMLIWTKTLSSAAILSYFTLILLIMLLIMPILYWLFIDTR